jgi:hypothetical protein
MEGMEEEVEVKEGAVFAVVGSVSAGTADDAAVAAAVPPWMMEGEGAAVMSSWVATAEVSPIPPAPWVKVELLLSEGREGGVWWEGVVLGASFPKGNGLGSGTSANPSPMPTPPSPPMVAWDPLVEGVDEEGEEVEGG